MNIFEKYNANRHIIKSGHLILFHGTSILSKIIERTDKSYASHIGIADIQADRIAIFDMWKGGLCHLPLSKQMEDYKDGDFYLIELNLTKEEIKKLLDFFWNKWQKGVKYDYATLLRIWAKKKTSIDIQWLGKKDEWICSEAIMEGLKFIGKNYIPIDQPTPNDFDKYLSEEIGKIILKDNL